MQFCKKRQSQWQRAAGVTEKKGHVLRWGEEEIRMGDVDMEWLYEIMRTNVAVGE